MKSWFAWLALVASCLIMGVSAGATPNPTNLLASLDLEQVGEFWKPYQLFLQASPHSQIYVEVGAVQGCEPSDATLERLRMFLVTYCAKPDGVEVVRGDVIPMQEASGRSFQALIRKNIKWPQSTGTNPPAFLYVLYFNGQLADQLIHRTNGVAVKPLHPPERDLHPNTQLSPYPFIMINTSYKFGTHLEGIMMLHEVGHMLGLATRPEGAKAFHCLNKHCLMHATVHLMAAKLLLNRYSLCDDCKGELKAHALEKPAGNLHFVGPVLVRSGTGYHVLSLPARVRLVMGDLTEQDCKEFFDGFKRASPSPENEGAAYVDVIVGKTELKDKAKLREDINRALADPYNVVQKLAATLQEHLKSRE